MADDEDICTVCGKYADPLHMCDRETEGKYCDHCWKQTDCGKGLHEEDCETIEWLL